MKCSGCGHENRDVAKFCEECAGPLGRKCGRCGADLRPVAKFCDECAAPLTGASPPRSADPRPYTPKHLAEKILTSRSALEGERKQVTVLFADVKGSMDLAEQVDPEEWHRIMDRFFAILSEGVHRFEGTINQYTGDGIMALFGAPIAHEDHAQRACYTALQLQQELRRYADEMRTERGLNFSVRMGPQLGRGRSRQDRRRPAHGLHGAGAHGRPCRANGTASRGGEGLADRAHGEARLWVLCSSRPGSDSDQGTQ